MDALKTMLFNAQMSNCRFWPAACLPRTISERLGSWPTGVIERPLEGMRQPNMFMLATDRGNAPLKALALRSNHCT